MKIVALVDEETYSEEDPRLEGKTDDICEQMEFHIAEALRFPSVFSACTVCTKASGLPGSFTCLPAACFCWACCMTSGH